MVKRKNIYKNPQKKPTSNASFIHKSSPSYTPSLRKSSQPVKRLSPLVRKKLSTTTSKNKTKGGDGGDKNGNTLKTKKNSRKIGKVAKPQTSKVTFGLPLGLVWHEEDIIQIHLFNIGFDKNIFWFGINTYKNIEDKKDNQVIGMKQIRVPMLVTSNRLPIEINYYNLQKWKFNFENIPTYLPHRWRLEDIKAYCNSKDKKFTGKELLEKIQQQYQYFVYIRNTIWYKIHSVWDISTYFYELFESFPLLELRGLPETAKSKTMTVSSYVSFNGGKIMINPSEATLFRERDDIRGTIYIDEAEKLWSYNKLTKQYEGDNRTELINASYTKEGMVPRQEKIGNKYFTKWYSVYGPTIVGSINGLHGATETRAITRISTKSPDSDERGETDPSETRNDAIWNDIRDMCYRFALNNWKTIYDSYLNFPKKIGLKKRAYQIWKPLLCIAKFIDEKIYEEILKFAIELSNRKIEDLIYESSFDYKILQALKKCIKNNLTTNNNKCRLDEIKQYYLMDNDIEEKSLPYFNRNISDHLDKLGFKELRSSDNKSSFFIVCKKDFEEIVGAICPKLLDDWDNAPENDKNKEKPSPPSPSSPPLRVEAQKTKGDGVVMGGDEVKTGINKKKEDFVHKTDRDIQFYDAEETKYIKVNCTEEEILDWIKNNPNSDYKQLFSKFPNCLGLKNQLVKRGIIIMKGEKLELNNGNK